ncbi:MAG TPA: serine hydrolase domain-containing protein [Gemmataceae bacterium]
MRTSRRAFLKQAGLAASAYLLGPKVGAAETKFQAFDKFMEGFLAEHKAPGAAVAVTHKGKLVHSKGYGFANIENKLPVQADALFRIASISKPITAAASLHLVDAKKLKLDDPVLKHVPLKPHETPGQKLDPRWQSITIHQCLRHTGGWDRDKSGDPIGIPRQIAQALGAKPPVSPQQIIRYMMGRPLDFNPGERYAYSNLGYLLLGRAIETAGGQPYEQFVLKRILAPLGITRMHLGRALPRFRAKGEVSYYDAKRATGHCLYPPSAGEVVPFPDGAANFEGYEAHGGWIASAIDLVKFGSAFDSPAACPILSRSSIANMWQRPPGLAGTDAKGKPRAAFYACGWNVRPTGMNGHNTWHTGLISGTSTILVRRHDGVNWAILFNTDRDAEGKVLSGLIDRPAYDRL